ncbi:MAG: hypothetical protein Kow0020_04420 [Wenzhouxiangellaceae bacterium]
MFTNFARKMLTLTCLAAFSSFLIAADGVKPILAISSEKAGTPIQELGRSIDRSSNRLVVDFVEGDEDVVALQFDVVIKGKSPQIDISNCGAGLPKTHFANCVIRSDGSVRVLVESATNAPLATTNIGWIEVSRAADFSFKKDSIVMSNISAHAVDFETVQ